MEAGKRCLFIWLILFRFFSLEWLCVFFFGYYGNNDKRDIFCGS